MNIFKNNHIQRFLSNKTLKDGIWFSLFSFVNRGFSFILLLILANYILPADYGYLNLFNTVVMVMGYFVAMSIEGYLGVAFFREGDNGAKSAFSCTFATTILVSGLLLSLLLVLGNAIGFWLNLPVNSLYLAIIISFFTVYTNLNLTFFRLKGKVMHYGMFSCGNALLNFIFSILLVKFFLMGWLGRVYAQTFCFTLFGLIGFFILVHHGWLSIPNLFYWKKMLIWGIPLIPHMGITFIRQGADRYIINYFHSIEDVGLFSFALNLANIILMIGYGFNQSNSIDIYHTLGNKSISSEIKLQRLNRLRKIIFFVYLFAALFVFLMGLITIPWVLPQYVIALKYFPFLSVYSFLFCLYLLYTNYLFYYGETRYIMLTTVSSSLLHLVLSLFLTRYSLYLTCSIYCLSQLFIVIIIRYMAMKTLHKELLYKK